MKKKTESYLCLIAHRKTMWRDRPQIATSAVIYTTGGEVGTTKQAENLARPSDTFRNQEEIGPFGNRVAPVPSR